MLARSLVIGGASLGLSLSAAAIVLPIRLARRRSRRNARAVAAGAALLAKERAPIPAALGAPQTALTVLPARYPLVRRDESVVEELHGVKIADPYRWLEDPDLPETQEFVAAQNELTKEVLAQCDTREQFCALFTKLYDYEKFGTPFKRGDRFYFYRNTGLQQHYVLYSQATLDSPATVLLDPNTLSEDGTVALKSAEFSEAGTLMAYSLSSGGSDWCTIHVMRVSSEGVAEPLPDKLEDIKFSGMTWTHDERGFFYNRYPSYEGHVSLDLGTETDINTNQMLCYHVLGTDQNQDPVVFAMPENPTQMCSAAITDDGRYLLLYISEGCQPANQLYYVDLNLLARNAQGAIDWAAYDLRPPEGSNQLPALPAAGSAKLPYVKLIDNFEASFSYVANEGTVFYLMTNLNAPRYRVVKVDIASPGPPSSWVDLVPEHSKDVLKSAAALKGDSLVVMYLRDVCGVLELHSLSTGALVRSLPLPGLGSISGFSGDRKHSDFFFSFQSFAEPGTTWRVDLAAPTVEAQLFRRTQLKVPHSGDDYVTKQVFVPSKDGTQVPMFITHRKGLKLDGRNPTLLYAYGGFNISLEPNFSASRLAFIKGYDGIYASANLRGGGEYGTGWRDAGSKQNKQNVFDDFQACAKYLTSNGYCSPAMLTIQGGSNGGLLVAACANQRPDMFACVLGQVGVMDMLRFHKFTIGHAWMTDYGNPDTSESFSYILPYSPLHNVCVPKGGTRQYPAMLLATGDHDDRVVPLHSHKLIATLQYELTKAPSKPAQRNPLLIRVEVRAGHGAGKPTSMIIAETSDLISFAAKCMKAEWKLVE